MGKGAFIGANDVARKIKKIYIGVENFIPRELPVGYTQIEYIEGTGTQYIDTGFNPDNNTRVDIDFQFTDTAGTSGWSCLFGAADSSSNENSFSVWLNTSALEYYYGSSSKSFSVNGNTDRHKANLNNATAAIDTDTITMDDEAFSCSKNLFLLATSRTGEATYFSDCKIFSCKIYDNGTIVRDYVPCVNASGIAGLYDLANKSFYQNAGTGNFNAGAILSSIAHKIKKAYIGDENSKARLFYSEELQVLYTGNCTQEEVTMSDKKYLLLTLTSSGTLTLSDTVEADVWLCSGGADGGTMSSNTTDCADGGNGGAFYQKTVAFKTANVIIGAANGVSQFNDFASTSAGSRAGGGGGKGASTTLGGYGGTAAPKSTLPFADSFFTRAPCAGGGGGGYYEKSYLGYNGGDGGSASGAGNYTLNGSTSRGYGGAGGSAGGGAGGGRSQAENSGYPNAGNATYYGSGGGGGGYYLPSLGSGRRGTGGNGYQGVCFVRIPL